MVDVAYLQNMGFMDANFPYPLAFCSAYNLALIIVSTLIFFCLAYIIIYITRWFFRLF